jgi:hypothetical protein
MLRTDSGPCLVVFVWRNHSEHSDMWKHWINAKNSSSKQVEFAEQADRDWNSRNKLIVISLCSSLGSLRRSRQR